MRAFCLRISVVSLSILFVFSSSAAEPGRYRYVIEVKPTSFGKLLDTNTNAVIGSAFILNRERDGKRLVATCAHVVKEGGIVFQTMNGNHFRTSLVYRDNDRDLAIMTMDTADKLGGLELGDFAKIPLDDPIKFYRWNSLRKSYEADYASVLAIGTVAVGSETTEFLEFEGSGNPTYAGSPVFNDSGKVIAVMSEAWQRQGIKGEKTVQINRALSIETLKPVLKIFTQEGVDAEAARRAATNIPATKLEKSPEGK
jgi:S1-C subfamily serine protease